MWIKLYREWTKRKRLFVIASDITSECRKHFYCVPYEECSFCKTFSYLTFSYLTAICKLGSHSALEKTLRWVYFSKQRYFCLVLTFPGYHSHSGPLVQDLQKQLQRAEPLLSKNGVNYQCAVFSHLQQTTYGFLSFGTHYCELKWSTLNLREKIWKNLKKTSFFIEMVLTSHTCFFTISKRIELESWVWSWIADNFI